jgi:glycosyltransferase involved in cell wall biosynthesis
MVVVLVRDKVVMPTIHQMADQVVVDLVKVILLELQLLGKEMQVVLVLKKQHHIQVAVAVVVDKLVDKVAARGLSDRIIFLGEIAPDAVGQWYQNVLITVACPRYEPFGLTPLEGMACGCAVVASDTGAFKTIVDEGVTGHVVPTDDVAALVAALRPVMQEPLRAAEMGRLGRQRVEQLFSVEREAAGVAAVYAHVWGQAETA